ncbi:MAG TPA: DUF302 domain-containing protein [Polyangiaceae bacterium]|jgi:uncharacterized protein (DUF302 family)
MANAGILDIRSHHSVPKTLDRLEALAQARGLLVFARIDFSGDAQRAGLSLRPMQMLLFGNPEAGTPLLQAAPRVGLDLPLKALAWEDADGTVWVSMNTPTHLGERHDLAPGLLGNLAPGRVLVEAAAGE